jgi:hypothetical protein
MANRDDLQEEEDLNEPLDDNDFDSSVMENCDDAVEEGDVDQPLNEDIVDPELLEDLLVLTPEELARMSDNLREEVIRLGEGDHVLRGDGGYEVLPPGHESM